MAQLVARVLWEHEVEGSSPFTPTNGIIDKKWSRAVNDKLRALQASVVEAAAKPSFIHHQWYTTYHLEIVYRLVDEILPLYSADADIVHAMVWLHDYGKILDVSTQYETTQLEGAKLLARLGFDDAFSTKVLNFIDVLDRKMEVDLGQAATEVKIISSADAASHYVGPFFQLYLYENAAEPYEELLKSNLCKATKDWDRKMVLPEVRAAFESRVLWQREKDGELPARFLS